MSTNSRNSLHSLYAKIQIFFPLLTFDLQYSTTVQMGLCLPCVHTSSGLLCSTRSSHCPPLLKTVIGCFIYCFKEQFNFYSLYPIFHSSENTLSSERILHPLCLLLTHPLVGNLWFCVVTHMPTFFFPVLGLELRTFTLSHSTSPIFVKGFSRLGLVNYLPGLASNLDPPDLCLLSS
jgi:hypothetical protein